jgi:hypothetical protein
VSLRAPLPHDHFTIVGTYVASTNSKLRITLIQPGVVDEKIVDLRGDGRRRRYHIDISDAVRHKGDRLYVYYYPPPLTRGSAQVSVALIQGFSADLVLTGNAVPSLREEMLKPSALGNNVYRIRNTGRVVQYDQTYGNVWQLSDAILHFWVRNRVEGTSTVSYRLGSVYAIAIVFSMVCFVTLGFLSIRPIGRAWRKGI